MALFNKFNSFIEDAVEGRINLSTDTLKIALTNTAPVATNTQLSNITQITAGNGYTAGGTQATTTSSSQSSGTYKLVLGDVTFTATGGSMGPFRYCVLYSDTSTNDSLIGWYDYGSSVTLNDTETFTVDFDPTNGALTIA